MTTLEQAGIQLRDELRATGVRATLEAADVNPPCVYLRLRQVEDRYLAAGVLNVEWLFYLCAPTGKAGEVYRHFDELRAAITPAGFVSQGPAEAVELQLPGGGKPVPALQCTIRTKIT